jgi:hypothetical protein
MTEDKYQISADATEEQLAEMLKEIAVEREQFEDLVGKISPWYSLQENNIFGALFKHLDKQIEIANSDEASHSESIEIEVPSDDVRIGLRKQFHSRVLKSLRFNFTTAAILLFLPVFFDFLDNAQFLTPLSIGIYPILAVATFIAIITFVIVRAVVSRAKNKLKNAYAHLVVAAKTPEEAVTLDSAEAANAQQNIDNPTSNKETKRRVRRGLKPLWGWKRVTGWVVVAFGFSTLVFFWPIAGVFARIIYKAPFFPSAWQIILVALLIFISRFTYSILNYYVHYRELYFKPANRAWKKIYWASRGLLIIRSDKKRFEIMKSQLKYWHRVYGQLLRRPWSLNLSTNLQRANLGVGAVFPPTVKIAQALDASADDTVAVTRLESIEKSLFHSLTRNGWRSDHFQEFFQKYRNMRDFSPAAKAIEKNLDSMTPATDEGLSREFEELVSNSRFLEYVGNSKLQVELESIQSEILKTGDLRVAVLRSVRDQLPVQDWNSHLKSILIDETKVEDGNSVRVEAAAVIPSELLQSWAFSKEANIKPLDSPNQKIYTFVLAPERIENELSALAGRQDVDVEPIFEPDDKSIDIVLRIDLVGHEGDLRSEDVRLPKIERPAIYETRICQECDSSVCQSLVGANVPCSNK